MSPNVYDDNGDELLRLRAFRNPFSSGYINFYKSLQIDMETGVGLTSGHGSDPNLMIRWSDDGGNNWTSKKRISIGKKGEYSRRVLISRLGSGRDRVWELSISDPVPVRFTGAFIDYEAGIH
jgi:hypothetical protein